MADNAQVRSVEAIEAFRARLVVYAAKARTTVEEITAEVQRTRQWLQTEQRRRWTEELRIRQKRLEQATSELSSARFSTLQDSTATQQMAVRKARDAVREAESKLVLLKRWERELDDRAEPLLKQTNPLQHLLNHDMPKAVAHLSDIVRTLDAYADLNAPGRGRSTSGSSQTSAVPADEPKPEEEL